MKFKILALFFSVFLFSCKSNKNLVDRSAVVKESPRKIIKKHYKNAFNAKTLSANLKVGAKTGSKSQNVSVKLRIQKDETIWLSGSIFGFTIAKAIITPEKIRYYIKPTEKYYEGDFSSLSKLIGTELDFYTLQNLLLGDALFKLKSSKFNSSIDQKSHLLTPKEEDELVKILLWIHPINYKIEQQEITDLEKKQSVNIKYEGYKQIADNFIPTGIKIKTKDSKNNIRIQYKSVKLNQKLSFPYKVPKGYTPIQK